MTIKELEHDGTSILDSLKKIHGAEVYSMVLSAKFRAF